MAQTYDVIIAGAGPIGLFLACELALAHTSVLILERDPSPSSVWKSKPLGLRGLNTASVEAFYRRGLLDHVAEPSPVAHNAPGFRFGGHFAGLLLNANKLDLARWPYRLDGPALNPSPTTIARVEAGLTERAEGLGVTILRGEGVARVEQDASGVTVETGDQQTPSSFRGKWLVGCDGGRSTVRKAAGFSFEGTAPTLTGYVARVDLDHPEKLKPGFQASRGGMYIALEAPNLYLLDFDGGAFDRSREITAAHMQGVVRRVVGEGVSVAKLHLASSFTDRCMQATRYRRGRVLLAGDAAHIHSPLGAQGLNLGLGDALNLGWKLAATIHAQTSTPTAEKEDLTLLNTYEAERLPLAKWVLEWTRAQVSVLRPDAFGTALRDLVTDLIATPDGTNLFLGRIWGLSQRYDLGDGQHPVVGCSVPEFELDDGSRLGSKMAGGRGVMVDFGEDEGLKGLVKGYEGKVDYVSLGAKDQLGLRALLVRPDGIVAWASEEEKPDTGAAKAALERWFRCGS
ncbi:monooxygenase [Hypoxylon fragiforme]|uniref:monooxygenase n=1 Tax=Hypoxylon fragiforme TaxID=63214 RepID=UPI0020C64A0C|nr:monooxygenase [Hypoxylon fragiforme]KAI2606941.1 monooxygenase [Hypoxylon fragiforme]